MDEDLANIIRQALDEAKAAGRDHTGQNEYAVRKVLELRPDPEYWPGDAYPWREIHSRKVPGRVHCPVQPRGYDGRRAG